MNGESIDYNILNSLPVPHAHYVALNVEDHLQHTWPHLSLKGAGLGKDWQIMMGNTHYHHHHRLQCPSQQPASFFDGLQFY